MPTVNQYVLSNKELVETIIRQTGIHEGKWVLQVNFMFTAGNFGQTEQDVLPGALIAVQQFGIQRADGSAPAALTVDAAEVNPA